MSEAKIKNWCAKSTTDEKMIFLTLIGANCGLTIMFNKAKMGVALKEIWDKYEAEKKAAAQQDHAKLKVFVTTSKETAFFMGLCGQTISNETYLRTLDFNKTGHEIRNWRKRLDSVGQEEISEVASNADLIANTIVSSGVTFDMATTLFGINDVETKILLYCYRIRHRYVSRNEINSHFEGYIAVKKINRAWKRLQLNDHLSKHPDWTKYECTISSSGVLLANDVISRILKMTQF